MRGRKLIKFFLLIGIISFFILTNKNAYSLTAFQEFDDFSFLSYNKYTINDTEKIGFTKSNTSDDSHTSTLTLKNMNSNYFYVLTTKTHDDNGDFMVEIGDTYKIDDYYASDTIVHKGLDLFWGTYLVASEYKGINYKNATTDFIYANLGHDFSCALFKVKQATIYRSQNGYLFNEEYGNSIILYEFSTKHELSNSLIEVDNMFPVVSGINYLYLVNYDNPDTFAQITANIRVIDNIDGDISNKVQYVTEYPKGADFSDLQVRMYKVYSSVSDSFNNITTFEFHIKVMDITKPIISGTKTYEYRSNVDSSAENIRNKLQAHDNYDGDITSKITIIEDQYTSNRNKVGTYSIKYGVSDEAGNETTYIVTVIVSDGIAPSINGSDSINSKKLLSDTEILNLYTASDDVDGNISSKLIVKSNSCPGLIKGTYQIVLEVRDNNNNITTKTISYTIYDDEAPVYWVTDKIQVSVTMALSERQITEILIEMGKVSTNEEVTLKSDYFNNTDKAGEYVVNAMCVNNNGDIRYEAITISVIANQSNSDNENIKSNDSSKESSREDIIKKIALGTSIVLSIALAIFLYIRKKY